MSLDASSPAGGSAPVAPTFLRARDAILASDCAGFAGEDEVDIRSYGTPAPGRYRRGAGALRARFAAPAPGAP